MKVESVVDRRVYCATEDDEYIFKNVCGRTIPTGARVTVEWDDSEHRCEKLTKRGMAVEKSSDGGRWYITSKRECWTDWIGPIDLCPCCGKELGGT